MQRLKFHTHFILLCSRKTIVEINLKSSDSSESLGDALLLLCDELGVSSLGDKLNEATICWPLLTLGPLVQELGHKLQACPGREVGLKQTKNEKKLCTRCL